MSIGIPRFMSSSSLLISIQWRRVSIATRVACFRLSPSISLPSMMLEKMSPVPGNCTGISS